MSGLCDWATLVKHEHGPKAVVLGKCYVCKTENDMEGQRAQEDKGTRESVRHTYMGLGCFRNKKNMLCDVLGICCVSFCDGLATVFATEGISMRPTDKLTKRLVEPE